MQMTSFCLIILHKMQKSVIRLVVTIKVLKVIPFLTLIFVTHSENKTLIMHKLPFSNGPTVVFEKNLFFVNFSYNFI